MSKTVLAISVHPDDETLGCGGTLLKHKSCGDKLYWLILTNISNEQIWGKEFIGKRQEEIAQVSSSYGFTETVKLNYETAELDQLPLSELTNRISEVIKRIQPDTIYLHNRSDIHSDHRVSFDAIMSSVKSFNNPFIEEVLLYETISETDFAPPFQENAFLPNYYVDISDFIDEKIEIMKMYSSEIKEHPFPRSERSLRALATLRGAQCGVDSAESFMILKKIWK